MASKEETLRAFNACMNSDVEICGCCPYKRYVNCKDKLRNDVRRALEEDVKPTTKPATYKNMFNHALDEYDATKHEYPKRIIMNKVCYNMLLSEAAHNIPEGCATYNGIRVEVIRTLESEPFFVFVDSWDKITLTKM